MLVRLAGAFDLTLAGLLLRAEGEGQRLSRVAEQPVWRDPETGYMRKQVFCRPDHPLEFVQVELPAGRRVVFPASSYAHIRQVVWVQTGELVILEGGERHVLGAATAWDSAPFRGDTLPMRSPRPCAYVVVLARS